MKSKQRKLRPSQLTIVHAVQRLAVESWIARLAGDLKKHGLGVVVVSRRADGTLAVLDGQHRILALLQLGMDDPIDCLVYEGLDEATEAEIFLLLQNAKRVSASDKLRIGAKAGRPECVGVLELLERHGLALEGDPNANGHRRIACAAALETEYKRRENKRSGAQALDRALATALKAFGAEDSALDRTIVTGLSLVYWANEWVDPTHMNKTLAQFPSGANGLIGRARGRFEFERGNLGACTARVIVDEYNKRRQKQRLEYPA